MVRVSESRLHTRTNFFLGVTPRGISVWLEGLVQGGYRREGTLGTGLSCRDALKFSLKLLSQENSKNFVFNANNIACLSDDILIMCWEKLSVHQSKFMWPSFHPYIKFADPPSSPCQPPSPPSNHWLVHYKTWNKSKNRRSDNISFSEHAESSRNLICVRPSMRFQILCIVKTFTFKGGYKKLWIGMSDSPDTCGRKANPWRLKYTQIRVDRA